MNGMSAEVRFVLAIALMLLVLVGSNLLFPPAPPPPPDQAPDPAAPGEVVREAVPEVDTGPTPEPGVAEPAPAPRPRDPDLPALVAQDEPPEVAVPEAQEDRRVVVEGPLYRMEFTSVGARLLSAELLAFRSMAREGAVQLVDDGEAGILGSRLVVGADTVDLRRAPFTVVPEGGLRLEPGGPGDTLTFAYQHPTLPFSFEIRYAFDPDAYMVGVTGRVRGLERPLLVTDLGPGLAFNEADRGVEANQMAYAVNHLQEGIRSSELRRVDAARMDDGPFHWVATRSQYFVLGLFPNPPAEGGAEYLGGVMVRPVESDDPRADLAAVQSLGSGGVVSFRLFAGPQDYSILSGIGHNFQEVNPVGWRFLRPILKPFVGVVTWILVFLHEALSVGYGWVLIIFGVAMRVILFPLNHKAMRAQLRNLAVQPLLKEIQTKYKDQPEKMQKELMRLYKEHGFNPIGGCWPMLLPWPILIALFFVFQNTIELRGVPFAWLPDLAAKDPFFILPVLLGVSMFLLQWVSLRTMEEVNPQMKMMMWFLPIFMLVIFSQLPSGLNLYYLTANLATLPQSWWIAQERQKVQAKGPPKGPSEPAEAEQPA
jgi:YidC/Oxa1 family membrane protein insertase